MLKPDKYKKIVFFFGFTLFCVANLIGQEIKIQFDKATCKINETIRISYEIPCHCDSVQEIKLNHFGKISGPAKSYSTTHLNGTVTESTRLTYLFKVMTVGKQKLPQIVVNENGKILKTEDFFTTVTTGPLDSESLKFKEYLAGTFHISLPFYMTKTTGVNEYSAIEYQSPENNAGGIVLYEKKGKDKVNKSIQDFYKREMKDFPVEDPKKIVSTPKFEKKGSVNFIQSNISCFDAEQNQKLYCFIGIAETKTAFYTFLSWAPIDKKDVFKSDFQLIMYSLKEQITNPKVGKQ